MKKPPPRIDPPCGDCRPPLLSENGEAVELYGLVSDDWISDPMGGIRGLSAPAIETALNLAGIEGRERLRLFGEVKLIGRTIVAELAEERKLREETRRDAQTERRAAGR